jgi:hypothetical protein
MTTHHDRVELRVKVGVGEEGVSWERHTGHSRPHCGLKLYKLIALCLLHFRANVVHEVNLWWECGDHLVRENFNFSSRIRLVFASAPLYTVFKPLWAQIMDSTATALFSLLASRGLRLRGRSILLDSDLTAFYEVEIQALHRAERGAFPGGSGVGTHAAGTCGRFPCGPRNGRRRSSSFFGWLRCKVCTWTVRSWDF